MRYRSSISAITLLSSLCVTMAGAWAWDDSKYPDFHGQWLAIGGPGRFARDQKAPLTPEYQAIFDSIKSEGGQGTSNMTYLCFSPGMPRVTNGYGEIEFVLAPTTFHILADHIYDNRRIFTDGRPWPESIVPTLLGYSIGQWIDRDGDGKYDVLEVETRGFRGPRAFDATGLPLHRDNQTIIKEKLYIDSKDSNIAHDEVTVIDHALTHPWTVVKNYRRHPSARPIWTEQNCAETNPHVRVGKDDYMVSADGFLMPTAKGQKAPDLKYFK
ncbi:MAG: hypothetical protein QOI12_4579 [Alphaproteobacteria bacterium]|nr:hypothetical protein [Alphaproteobacteria bacterium]